MSEGGQETKSGKAASNPQIPCLGLDSPTPPGASEALATPCSARARRLIFRGGRGPLPIFSSLRAGLLCQNALLCSSSPQMRT